MDVGFCLRKLDVNPGVTIDDKGKERFHPLSLMEHFNGSIPGWMYKYAAYPVQTVNF